MTNTLIWDQVWCDYFYNKTLIVIKHDIAFIYDTFVYFKIVLFFISLFCCIVFNDICFYNIVIIIF
jgi:hypothetical protein